MLSPKTIHFIIPCFEGKNTIRDCLESIAKQDYPAHLIKISIVENGPRTIDPSITESFTNCTYHYNPIKGRSEARNFLLDQVDSDAIAFIDVDVVISRSWLRECLEAMKSPFCAATSGPVFRKGTSRLDHFRRKMSEVSTNSQCNTMENPFTLGCLNTAAVLIRTNVLKRLNGFDTSFTRSEDHELTQRLLRSGYIISTTAHATAEVSWDRNIFEYFFTRSFEMGLYTTKSNIVHGMKTDEPFNLGFMKRLEKKADRIGWLVTQLCFELGRTIGAWRYSHLKQWTPIVMPKRCLILKMHPYSTPKLNIYELNSQWEIVNIRNNIHLFNRETGKCYRLQHGANEVMKSLLNRASFTVNNIREEAWINSMISDNILKIVQVS